jgi:hypothetical protein
MYAWTSFLQICFLGSLWYKTFSPFRCLDEWDVFLDNATRDKGEKQLVEIAQSYSDQVNNNYLKSNKYVLKIYEVNFIF